MAWLAGLLEGEGSFGFQKQKGKSRPIVSLRMTDRDIVARVATIFGTKVHGPYRSESRGRLVKPIYSVRCISAAALSIMEQVLPWLGERRAAKTNQIFTQMGYLPVRAK